MKTIIILDLICMLALATTLTSFSVSTVMAQNVTDVQQGANNTATDETKVSIVEGASDFGNKSYQPSPIKIKVGDTITWTNDDSITPHTVTEGNPSSSMSGAGFDSGLLSQGQTFKHTFNKVGVVEYFCSLHPTMVGKVSVSS
jgi:plastocyanin